MAAILLGGLWKKRKSYPGGATERDAALRDEFKRVFKCWKRFRAELYHDGAWRKYFTEPGAPDEVALFRSR